MLESSPTAAFALPAANLARVADTRELDHVLAQTYGLWGLVIGKKKPFAK